MPKSSEILFVSSNWEKYAEARDILAKSGMRLDYRKHALGEIQSDSLKEIATTKAKDALSHYDMPLLVEDTGLFITALGGFPGPYSSYVYRAIGNHGVLRALGSLKRDAVFEAVIAYAKPREPIRVFVGSVCGTISKDERGHGWGYDPIFIPTGRTKTYAEISDKNAISHRAAALGAFARWLSGRPQSPD